MIRRARHDVRRALLVVALAFGAGTTAARAETPVGGIVVGAGIAEAIRAAGPPASVETTDSGTRFTFANGTAYADDDGTVLAAEATSGSVTLAIDARPRRLTIGTYTSAAADADLAGVAEFAGNGVRTYRLSPARELVLAFDAGQRLTRVVYGERGQIARLGFLPSENLAKTVPFSAPKIRRGAVADGSGASATIVRLDVDRLGAVTGVSIVMPSGDGAFDARVQSLLARERFVPAQLGGRAIGASVFRELRH